MGDTAASIEDVLATELRERSFSDATFKSVFGRSPNLRHDRNFLMNYLTSVEKTQEDIIEGYLSVGITKAQLAAIYETGIVPFADNASLFPSRLLNRWLELSTAPESVSVIDRRLNPRLATHPIEEAATDIYLEISHSVIRLCHLLETGAKRAHKSILGQFFLYLLARIVQLLRSIRTLINRDETSSVLILVRGVYECFGRLLLVNRRPELAYGIALAGYVDGSNYEYCKNRNGRPERRKVRNIESGEEYRVDYSLSEIFSICDADFDAQVHQIFYTELSAEVHPTAELIAEFVYRKGFLLHREQDILFQMYHIGYVLYLVWREVSVFPLLSRRDRRDARHGLNVVRSAMIEIINGLSVGVEKMQGDSDFSALFKFIQRSVEVPYGDKYWNAVAEST